MGTASADPSWSARTGGGVDDADEEVRSPSYQIIVPLAGMRTPIMAEFVSLVLFLLAAAAVCVVGDALTIRSWRERTFAWGWLDGLQHGIVGIAVALPLLLGTGQWWPWGLVFAAASLVDVDHFLPFPSWWPVSAQDREHKRFLHSLFIAVGAGLIVALAGGGWEFGWLVAVGVISHLCRDATMGTVPLFFPAKRAVKWGRPSYLLAELLLTGLTFLVVHLTGQ